MSKKKKKKKKVSKKKVEVTQEVVEEQEETPTEEMVAATEENAPEITEEETAEEIVAAEAEETQEAQSEEGPEAELAVGETGSLLEEEKLEAQGEEEAVDLPDDLNDVQIKSILESVLFAADGPMSFAAIKGVFHHTNADSDKLKRVINDLQTDYAGGDRGIALEEVAGGFQLRTKVDNRPWVTKQVKGRAFRLSGAAMEVLSVIAYKQPVVKHEVDQIRGVESGHLVRALMEKNLVRFAGKSELPGKPMMYATTKEFLELFNLRNIRELPTLSEIEELIPEGIEPEEAEKETLGDLTDKLGLPMGQSYSESESELLTISEDLAEISTSSEFFEEEKKRQREARDRERAQDIRERVIMGEEISEGDDKWLKRYESKMEAIAKEGQEEEPQPQESQSADGESQEVQQEESQEVQEMPASASEIAAEDLNVAATEEQPVSEEPDSEVIEEQVASEPEMVQEEEITEPTIDVEMAATEEPQEINEVEESPEPANVGEENVSSLVSQVAAEVLAFDEEPETPAPVEAVEPLSTGDEDVESIVVDGNPDKPGNDLESL